MNFWISFWTAFFVASLVLFAALAVVVTIGGFFNIRSLFKRLAERADQSEEYSPKEDG
ncbi:MAG: hypothetical protein ISS79_01575 [Phycisphaerae bacterium]|nr:hypothetical protein [Phycisphaerae bacterium]